MSNYIKVSEYAQQQDVSQKTVYRWLKNNEISGKKIKGQWHVKVDDNNTDKDELFLTLKSKNDQLESQNVYLQDRLQQAQDTIDNMQEKHDEAQQQSNMIVMQLTKQLENQNRMLEDLRNRSLWVKVRAALGFASA